jgi:hypothetical protein
MTGGMRVRGRMPVAGVAAADVPAGQADAQHLAGSTFLAGVSRRYDRLVDLLEMRAA